MIMFTPGQAVKLYCSYSVDEKCTALKKWLQVIVIEQHILKV